MLLLRLIETIGKKIWRKLRAYFDRFRGAEWLRPTAKVEFCESWYNDLFDKAEKDWIRRPARSALGYFPEGINFGDSSNLQFLWSTALENQDHWVLQSENLSFMPWGGNVVGRDNKIILESGAWFPESMHQGEAEKVLKSGGVPVKRISGSVVYLFAPAANNYYHWLFDVLPRFYLLEQSGVSIFDYDKIVMGIRGLPFQLESLDRVGIPIEKIMMEVGSTAIRADVGVVTSRPFYRNGIPAKWGVGYVKNLFLDHKNISRTKSKKYFIWRDPEGKRPLINQALFFDELAKYGFEKLVPEKYSIDEQVKRFSEASVIVAVHGAGLANIAFCSAGTKILEILPPGSKLGCYWWLAAHCGLDYAYIVADGVWGAKDGPLEIDIGDVVVKLRKWI